MISPVVGTQPKGRDGKEPVLVRISVASSITGYSVNYLYHLASTGTIPCVKRGRTLRFDADELKQWMRQQYVPASNRLPDEKKEITKRNVSGAGSPRTSVSKGSLIPCTTSGLTP